MIVAELKDLSSLETYRPDGPFGIHLFAIVGPSGSAGEESFGITVCTTEWFEQNVTANVAADRRHLFVRHYDYDEIKQYLVKYCSACTGSSWKEIANKVARIGFWEFEDYKPHRDHSMNT
jgi:hypothetical protein